LKHTKSHGYVPYKLFPTHFLDTYLIALPTALTINVNVNALALTDLQKSMCRFVCTLLYITARSRLGLGVEDGRIPDGFLTATSMWNKGHGPQRARLNIARTRSGVGAWCGRHNNRRQFLQVDIGSQAKVVAIATQGRQDANQWVKSYKISSSKDGIRYKYYPKVC
jgi:hypothetical protein